MKIAILFSGRISFFQKSYPNIMENIVQGNEVDFFISYPKDPDINETNAFLERFEPKVFMESNESYFYLKPKYNRSRHANYHNMMCMYLNRKNVCELFKKYIEENNTHYDLVISYRIDYLISSKLDLNILYEKSNHDQLCIPEGNDYLGLNDQMALGNMNIMIKYLSCYDSLQNMFEKGTILHPETILYDYIKLNNIKTFRFPLKTDIILK